MQYKILIIISWIGGAGVRLDVHASRTYRPENGWTSRSKYIGAFALMISDDIVRASSSRAPEAGPAASALALLAHKPGLSIRMLAVGVGLSHAGTVRLVDRLATEELIERREHSTDGRTRSLYLTSRGKVASDQVLASRDQVIAEGLSILDPDELKVLCNIAERVLRNRLENLEQSYRICRLCCYDGCTNCPIDAELLERGVDRARNDAV